MVKRINLFKTEKRWKQIGNWIIEVNNDFIKETKRILNKSGVRVAFRYFRDNLVYSVNSNSSLRYLIEENIEMLGEEKVYSKLFKILFGTFVPLEYRRKTRGKIQRDLKEQIKEDLKYRAMATKTVEVVYTITKEGRAIKRYRNIKNKRFVKKPKGAKI